VRTMEDVERVRGIAARLDELGVPRRTTDAIRRWANGEQKRIRNEAREKSK
jgi:hypothetical protein